MPSDFPSTMSVNGRRSDAESGMTLAVVGCGTMGIAILSGILADIQKPKPFQPFSSNSGTSTPVETVPIPNRFPSRFIACVRRPESSKKVKDALRKIDPALFDDRHIVRVVQNDNINACKEAEVVLLGCKPYMVDEILQSPGMREALEGKLLISICAGVPVSQIEAALYGDSKISTHQKCTIVRAMPNTAAGIRESMTVIASCTPALSGEVSALVEWIFERIGKVVHLPPSNMDASTALCGSGPAFFALMLEAAIDGAVAMGLPRAEALKMAAQTMKGTAVMVLEGEHPALLRDKVTTPGGCTIGGLLVLEEGRVRGTVARAVREATVVASQLGKGVQGVNGTRF